MKGWTRGSSVARCVAGATACNPPPVGVPVGGRRRAAGLRREELAGLAGISVDYLTRLEQGPSNLTVGAGRPRRSPARCGSPTPNVTSSFDWPATRPPGHDVVSSRITPSVQRLLDRVGNTPVAVFDATWTLIVANAPYYALMGQTTSRRGIERNSVWRHLVGPGSRAVQTRRGAAELEPDWSPTCG